jgi:hypothetical protein
MKIELPVGVTSKLYPDKIRFIGDKDSISVFAERIRNLKDLKTGALVKLGEIKVGVSEEITYRFFEKNFVEMPGHAWNIFASKIQDVVEGFEENPFDFNDCGYLYPKLQFDIGVEITE